MNEGRKQLYPEEIASKKFQKIPQTKAQNFIH